MTIDERLEKLTERHDALLQYMELKSRSDRERHEAMAMSLELLIVEQRQFARQTTAEFETVTTLIRAMAEGITGLTAIVRNHEQRISDLES